MQAAKQEAATRKNCEEPQVGPVSLRPSEFISAAPAATISSDKSKQEVGTEKRQQQDYQQRNSRSSSITSSSTSAVASGTQIDSQSAGQQQQQPAGGPLSRSLGLSRQQQQQQQPQQSSGTVNKSNSNSPSEQSHRIKVTLTSAPRESFAGPLSEQQLFLDNNNNNTSSSSGGQNQFGARNSQPELTKRQSTATLISASGIESASGSQNFHPSEAANFSASYTSLGYTQSGSLVAASSACQQVVGSLRDEDTGGGSTSERRKNQEDQLRRIASQRTNRAANLTSVSRAASQRESGRQSQLIKSSSQVIGLSQSPSTNLLIEKQPPQNQFNQQQQQQQQQQLQQQQANNQPPNPKQLAIYINGKIRSNSIFCHSSSGNSLTNSILNKFHITTGAASSSSQTQQDQVAGSGGGRDQGASSASSLRRAARGKSGRANNNEGANKRVIPGIYIDDKQSPLKRTKLSSVSRSGSNKNKAASYAHNLVSNLRSGAGRILSSSCVACDFASSSLSVAAAAATTTTTTTRSVGGDSRSQIQDQVSGANFNSQPEATNAISSTNVSSANNEERNASETKTTRRRRRKTKIEITQVGGEIGEEEEQQQQLTNRQRGRQSVGSAHPSSLDSHEDQDDDDDSEPSSLDHLKAKSELNLELDQPSDEQTTKTSYKLNPSSMFLRKAMRYYRLWIYCANVTIFIGTLIFLLAALYVASDFRIRLLVGSAAPSSGGGELAANQNQNNLHKGNSVVASDNYASSDSDNNNNNNNNNDVVDDDYEELISGGRKSASHNNRKDFYHDIGVSYSEPSVVLAYIVIAIQAGILQAIGCLGAIRMKEKLIQTFWYLILALTFVDVLFLMYWLNRYDFIVKALRHHMTARLTNNYGHLAIIAPDLDQTGGLGLQADQDAAAQPEADRSWNSTTGATFAAEFKYQLDKILTDIIDKIQADSQCCGITDPIDYERSNWRRQQLSRLEGKLNLSSSERNEFDELLRQVPLVPASCCRRHYHSSIGGSPALLSGSGNQNKRRKSKKTNRTSAAVAVGLARDKSSGSLAAGQQNQVIDLQQQQQQQQLNRLADSTNQRDPNGVSPKEDQNDEPEFSADNHHRQVLEADNPMAPITMTASASSSSSANDKDTGDRDTEASGQEAKRLRDAIAADNISGGELYSPELPAATLSHAFKAEEHDEFAWLSKGKRRLLAKQDNYNLWLRDMALAAAGSSGSAEGAGPAVGSAADETDEGEETNDAASSLRLRRWIVESMVDNKQRVLSRLVELVTGGKPANSTTSAGSATDEDNGIGADGDELASNWAKLAALRRLLFVDVAVAGVGDENDTGKLITAREANQIDDHNHDRASEGDDGADEEDNDDDQFTEAKFRWPNELALSFGQYKIMESYLLTAAPSDYISDETANRLPEVRLADDDSSSLGGGGGGGPPTSCCRDDNERLMAEAANGRKLSPAVKSAMGKMKRAVGHEESPVKRATNMELDQNPKDKRRVQLLGELYDLIRHEQELGCSPRSYFDQATIYTQGCHLYIKSWLDSSWNILFVTGLCVLTTLKICSLVLLRLEIREMIHKIRVLKGMATEYNALHDLEAYLPRPSVCAQAAELTPSGVAAAISSPTSGPQPPGAGGGGGGGSSSGGVSSGPHRLGGSFSEAVVAAATAASGANHQLSFPKGSLSSADRAASMKAVASAMSSMLTPSMCTRSSSASTAHLHAAASSLLGAQKQALSLRSDLFPTNLSMPRRHTAISVCPAAAAAAAAAAAHHLMSRRGTYVANPIYSPQFTFGGASSVFGPSSSLGKGQAASSMCGIGPGPQTLAQHRHSAHTVHSLYSHQQQQQQLGATSAAASTRSTQQQQQQQQLSYGSNLRGNTNTSNSRNFLAGENHQINNNNNNGIQTTSGSASRRPSAIEHQSSGDSSQQPQVAGCHIAGGAATSGQGHANTMTSGGGNRSPSAGSSHQLLSLVYPFKRQSSGGAQSAGNFSLDLSPSLLTESRRSIH